MAMTERKLKFGRHAAMTVGLALVILCAAPALADPVDEAIGKAQEIAGDPATFMNETAHDPQGFVNWTVGYVNRTVNWLLYGDGEDNETGNQTNGNETGGDGNETGNETDDGDGDLVNATNELVNETVNYLNRTAHDPANATNNTAGFIEYVIDWVEENVLNRTANAVKDALEFVGGILSATASGAASIFIAIGKGGVAVIGGVCNIVIEIANGIGAVLNAIGGGMAAALSAIGSAASALAKGAGDAMKAIGDGAIEIGEQIGNAISMLFGGNGGAAPGAQSAQESVKAGTENADGLLENIGKALGGLF